MTQQEIDKLLSKGAEMVHYWSIMTSAMFHIKDVTANKFYDLTEKEFETARLRLGSRLICKTTLKDFMRHVYTLKPSRRKIKTQTMQHYTKTIEYTGVTFEDVAEFGKHEGNTFTFLDITFNKEGEDTFLFKRAHYGNSWSVFKPGRLLLVGSDKTINVIGVNEVDTYGYVPVDYGTDSKPVTDESNVYFAIDCLRELVDKPGGYSFKDVKDKLKELEERIKF